MMSETNPLSSLTPEQIDKLLKALTKTTTVPKVVARDQDQELCFYLIRDGCFETTVPQRDADSPQRAFELAHESLQPWYFVGTTSDMGSLWCKGITHNEWVDWVRS